MAEPLFVSQHTLEQWLEKEEVAFSDDVLTLLDTGARYQMEAAVRVLALLDGEDSAGLMGRVWAVSELEQKGAEHSHDSVILGDTAYQCEVGFVGRTRLDAPAAQEEPQAQVASSIGEALGETAKDGSKSEVDLLTDFFLKNI